MGRFGVMRTFSLGDLLSTLFPVTCNVNLEGMCWGSGKTT